MLNSRSRMRLMLGGTIAATMAVAACKSRHEAGGDVSRNWQPTASDQVMGVPAAAIKSALDARLAAKPPAPLTADEWKHVKHLYSTFNDQLLWLDDKGVHQPRVSALLVALAGADSDGIALGNYPLGTLASALSAVDGKHPTAEQLADADVLLSASFATYGENMLTGELDPAKFGQSWHINPREEHVDSALVLTMREDDFSDGLKRMRPQDPGYDSLRVAYVQFRNVVARGGWGTVPEGRALKRGDTDSPARIQALRARLSAEGFLADSGAPAAAANAPAGTATARASRTGPNVYDRQLAAAVADFQAHHGIVVDSMLGTETVTAMNVPANYRLAEIAANLERYRWMPRTLGSRYILVNVPQFHLDAYDSGQKALSMKVVVGQDYEDKATPVFSDSMEFVVFRPYWNVTPDIAAKEVFPKIAEDPGYLARNNMEVYSDHGQRAVRQLPGPKNSLGLVKFMFPNDFNIYLHDTPNDELFKKDVRAFSHGCVRLEKPAELATWVLGWPMEKVQQAMNDGPNNHQVNLPKKIPVYIVYFTTYVQGGQLYFGNDLYERDSTMVDALENVALPSQETARAQQALLQLAKS
ncbi:MAG TPA: L,D-transpeptidase family protein [Gemmatimonadaceae bacterium]|nr:L,D-transpeptidase family protein [Gemmatimonadaceae bacterium]